MTKRMSDKRKDFPLEIEDVEEVVAEEIRRYYKGQRTGFVRVGQDKYLFSDKYYKHGIDIYNMPLKSDDVMVVSYPRSGTTVTQEMVWLICNNLDFKKSAEISLWERYTFIEMCIMLSDGLIEDIKNGPTEKPLMVEALTQKLASAADILPQTPSPCFIKTHLPFALLPPNTLDTCKSVYVARDPRDVVVSYYHHNKLIKIHGYVGDFKTYWRHFKNNMYIYTPFFPHVKEAWKLRNNPNMFFLFYHDIITDMPGVIKRVSEFFGKHYTEEQVSQLSEHLNIKNFRNNKSCNIQFTIEKLSMVNKGNESFVRQGKSGSWRDYFDEEMTKEADEWIAENLKDTDLRFPTL